MNELEKNLQAKILRKINKLPGVVAFANVVTAYSPTGHPDIYGTVYGYGFWGEVKLPGKGLTKIQSAFLVRIEGRGIIFDNTFIWNTVKEAEESIKILKTAVEYWARDII